jgi:hypothetical protein
VAKLNGRQGARLSRGINCRPLANALTWRRDEPAGVRITLGPGNMGVRCGKEMVAAALAAVLWFGAARPVAAAKGDTRTTIFVGTTTYSDEKATTFGTTFGVKWALEFRTDLEWTVSGQYTVTEGQHEVAGETYDIEARTSTFQTGLTRLFNNDRRSTFVWFLGGGLSVLSYDLNFDYPGGEVGETSGVGPGVFGLAGVEIRLAKNVSFIPEYVVNAHAIQTEDGDTFTLLSAGLVVAVRIGI